jgi:senataxin
MSASEMLTKNVSEGDFEFLIVDEACQSVELSCLIPFMHDPRKIILVGDHQQLPATVFSENASRTRYSRSLFERFLDCKVPNFMLSIQYRMDSAIRKFPSDQFYNGNLTDDPSISTRDLDPALVQLKSNLGVKPTIFFDLSFSNEC